MSLIQRPDWYTALCGCIGTADSALIRKVAFILSVLYRRCSTVYHRSRGHRSVHFAQQATLCSSCSSPTAQTTLCSSCSSSTHRLPYAALAHPPPHRLPHATHISPLFTWMSFTRRNRARWSLNLAFRSRPRSTWMRTSLDDC